MKYSNQSDWQRYPLKHLEQFHKQQQQSYSSQHPQKSFNEWKSIFSQKAPSKQQNSKTEQISSRKKWNQGYPSSPLQHLKPIQSKPPIINAYNNHQYRNHPFSPTHITNNKISSLRPIVLQNQSVILDLFIDGLKPEQIFQQFSPQIQFKEIKTLLKTYIKTLLNICFELGQCLMQSQLQKVQAERLQKIEYISQHIVEEENFLNEQKMKSFLLFIKYHKEGNKTFHVQRLSKYFFQIFFIEMSFPNIPHSLGGNFVDLKDNLIESQEEELQEGQIPINRNLLVEEQDFQSPQEEEALRLDQEQQIEKQGETNSQNQESGSGGSAGHSQQQKKQRKRRDKAKLVTYKLLCDSTKELLAELLDDKQKTQKIPISTFTINDEQVSGESSLTTTNNNQTEKKSHFVWDFDKESYFINLVYDHTMNFYGGREIYRKNYSLKQQIVQDFIQRYKINTNQKHWGHRTLKTKIKNMYEVSYQKISTYLNYKLRQKQNSDLYSSKSTQNNRNFANNRQKIQQLLEVLESFSKDLPQFMFCINKKRLQQQQSKLWIHVVEFIKNFYMAKMVNLKDSYILQQILKMDNLFNRQSLKPSQSELNSQNNFLDRKIEKISQQIRSERDHKLGKSPKQTSPQNNQYQNSDNQKIFPIYIHERQNLKGMAIRSGQPISRRNKDILMSSIEEEEPDSLSIFNEQNNHESGMIKSFGSFGNHQRTTFDRQQFLDGQNEDISHHHLLEIAEEEETNHEVTQQSTTLQSTKNKDSGSTLKMNKPNKQFIVQSQHKKQKDIEVLDLEDPQCLAQIKQQYIQKLQEKISKKRLKLEKKLSKKQQCLQKECQSEESTKDKTSSVKTSQIPSQGEKSRQNSSIAEKLLALQRKSRQLKEELIKPNQTVQKIEIISGTKNTQPKTQPSTAADPNHKAILQSQLLKILKSKRQN